MRGGRCEGMKVWKCDDVRKRHVRMFVYVSDALPWKACVARLIISAGG